MQIQEISRKTAYLCSVIALASVILFITGRNTSGNIFLYQFSHGNIFHLLANIIPMYLFLKSANDWKTWFLFVVFGYLISVVSASAVACSTLIGVSGWVFAVYGMFLSFRYKGFGNGFFSSGNVFGMLLSLSIGFFIHPITGAVHLISWILGLITGYLLIQINRYVMFFRKGKFSHKK